MANQLRAGPPNFITESNGRIGPTPTVKQRRRDYIAALNRRHQEQLCNLRYYDLVRRAKSHGDIPNAQMISQPARMKDAAISRDAETTKAEEAEEKTQPILILKTGHEDFWSFYTPGYDIPNAGISDQWQYLPVSETWMKERWDFVKAILHTHERHQQELDKYVQNGVFKKEDVWKPIFKVCTATHRFYPTVDYDAQRDPFLHIHPIQSHYMFYNKVFHFTPIRDNNGDDTRENQQKFAQLNSVFAGYNQPHLGRCQVDDDSIIPLLIEGGQLAAGNRGPWQMVPTRIDKTVARRFTEQDRKLYEAIRLKADTDWGHFGDPDFYHAHPELFQPRLANTPTRALTAIPATVTSQSSGTPPASPSSTASSTEQKKKTVKQPSKVLTPKAAPKQQNGDNTPSRSAPTDKPKDKAENKVPQKEDPPEEGDKESDANISVEVIDQGQQEVEVIPRSIDPIITPNFPAASNLGKKQGNPARKIKAGERDPLPASRTSQKKPSTVQEAGANRTAPSAARINYPVSIPFRRETGPGPATSTPTIRSRWADPHQVKYTLEDVNKSFCSKAHRLCPEATELIKNSFPNMAKEWGLTQPPDRRNEIPVTETEARRRDRLKGIQQQISGDSYSRPRTRASSSMCSSASPTRSDTNSDRDTGSPRSSCSSRLASSRKRRRL